MGEVAEPMFHGFPSILHQSALSVMQGGEKFMEEGFDVCDSRSSSIGTNESDVSSSMDSEEVNSSSSISPPQMDSGGPLYELTPLMATLPIKRGLSRYFQGKSQSFTSLSKALSIEDLAKKEMPYKKKMKPSKSYAGGIACNLGTKSTITKKHPRASCSSLAGKRIGSFLGGRPPIPQQRNL